MIKINLLPPRKKKAVVTGQRHLALIIVLLLVESVGLAFVYQQQHKILSDKKAANDEKAREVTRLKKEIGDLSKLEKERSELEQQQKILDTLEKARSGPVKVLDDIALLLTPPTTERIRKALKARKLNVTWDPRRVSLTSFQEKSRQVEIEGLAKTNDDVAEFMKRLESSAHFYDVQLQYTKSAELKELDVPVVSFVIHCRISYTGKKNEQILFNPKDAKKRRRRHG